MLNFSFFSSMVSLGVEGYSKHADEIMQTVRRIADGVRKIAGLQLLGKAQAMVGYISASTLSYAI